MSRFPILLLGLLSPAMALAQTPPPPARPPAPDPIDLVDVSARLASAPYTKISNGQIDATVLLPDTHTGFYRGTRFDWSGLISSLTVHGQAIFGTWFDQIAPNVRDFVTFKGKIVSGPNTAVLGPVDAYDASGPQSWADAAPGGVFLKIGVGLLRKPEDGAAYSSFKTYEIIDGGQWTTRSARDHVTFQQVVQAKDDLYGYVYIKTLRLVPGKPELLVEHSLRNTGRQTLKTTSFNHNFLTLAGDPTADGLSLKAPFQIVNARPLRDVAEVNGDQLTYRRSLNPEEVLSTPITGFETTLSNYDFTLSNRRGAGYRVQSERPLSALTLWSIKPTVAVEPFITLDIPAGATEAWTFHYSFMTAR